MTEPLDPLTLPLRGSRLIEASAGTGKTWTIAALYLRLVLGHGGPPAAFGRPLAPGEILVMTFTKAATRELSDRIRSRLVEAAACFRGESVPAAHDSFLADLLARHADGDVRAQAAWRLAMAAEAMDDAAVYTIDAWCQRMLREHAFDSGCLFDEELQADESAMRSQAARDYWRQNVYPLAGAPLSAALTQWKTVGALATQVGELIDRPLPPDAGRGSLHDLLARLTSQRSETIAALKQGWDRRADEMQHWLDQQFARADRPFDGRQLKAMLVGKWLAVLRQWALDPQADDLALTDAARKRLVPAGLSASLKDKVSLAIPDVFRAFEVLLQALQALPRPGPAMRLHAAANVLDRLAQMKSQAGSFGFADMLERLDAALDLGRHGDKALRLRQRIVAQYPAALVDEFQDTSPIQLRIFDRLYRIADDDPSTALLLIGDPKQSIYAFRGADIYSYLNARHATAGRHHALATNHRSTRALVDAVNGLFGAAEARAGQGAFMFREEGSAPVSASGLPFEPVNARGRVDRLVTSHGPVRALTISLDTTLRNPAESREHVASLCAERIVTLLNDPGAGFALPAVAVQGDLFAPLPGFQRLRPADIAVLVRTGIEAAAMRKALRQRGVTSVYLSDKDTVFATPEALDLMRLLRAIASPRDMRLARAAFATAMQGLDVAELLAMATDDALFDARCEQLRALHVVWQTQGVLAGVRRALHDFDLPARWLATDDGERRLTNVLHLAELLQSASTRLEGEQAQIRWMAQQIDAAATRTGDDDAQVLRLESDADLVQVVTVYKSKGLEYPLVFLPFAAHVRIVNEFNTPVVYLPNAEGGRSLDLTPDAGQIALADIERQREDIRLLYVALTRARHALWVGASALSERRGGDCIWHRSAIGYLLSGARSIEAAALAADVHAFASRGVDAVVETVPAADEATHKPLTRLLPRDALPALLPARPYGARFDRNWSISSYSALVRDVARDAGGAAARTLRDDEPTDEQDGVAAAVAPVADLPWHRFPRGAFAGNFLHGQLEWLAEERFALDTSEPLQQALLRRCERQGWGARSADALAWLRLVCSTPLPPVGAPLAGLTTIMPEMEFWFPSDGLRAARVDDLCAAHLLPGRARPALPERSLRGMLMGFADLVFEHGGRYWVLDYKSNALGTRDADYTQAAMAGAMLEHRYDVQAALYLLALHRLLRSRLGAAYDPARQLGGAVYLFLRGVRGPAAGCHHVAPPMGLIDGLDAMLVSRDAAAFGEAA